MYFCDWVCICFLDEVAQYFIRCSIKYDMFNLCVLMPDSHYQPFFAHGETGKICGKSGSLQDEEGSGVQYWDYFLLLEQ